MNEAKTLYAPIVLVDPVDPERNAAAALSRESYAHFREQAQAFLAEPHASFFDTTLSKQRIITRWKGKHVLFVTAATPQGKQDIVGCQVLAQHERAIAHLTDAGFPLVHAEWRFGVKESVCWYVLATTRMPAETEQHGPPANMPEAVEFFRAKHPRAFLRESRWYAPIKRDYAHAEDAIRAAWHGMRHTLLNH